MKSGEGARRGNVPLRFRETGTGAYRVEWWGGHMLHLMHVGPNDWRGRTWHEVAVRTTGPMDRDYHADEASADIKEWCRWIESGDQTALLTAMMHTCEKGR